MAKVRKQHLFRALLTDVEIDPARPGGAHVIFHCADADLVFEVRRETAERLRDQISAELDRVSTRARRRSSSPTTTSRNK